MRKLLQICKQFVTRLLSSRYQDVFALLVPSCCDKSETSCYRLVTRLVTVTNLLQVVAMAGLHYQSFCDHSRRNAYTGKF
jgi:hypothetical protein